MMDGMRAGLARATLSLAVLAAVPSAATAQIELEADPIAYALNGFSLHLAKIAGPIRVNVGTFGLDVPAAYHGNEGWTSTMRGAGVKVDWLGSSPDGLFAGVEGGYMRNRYALEGMAAEKVHRNVVGVGVRGGYRLPIGGSGLYVAPWVGVSYNFNGEGVAIAGRPFERSAIGVFPTIHLGWRF